MTRKDTAALLNELIETSHDGEKGYAKAAKEMPDPTLKAVLVEGAMRCREGARELEERVRGLGLEPETGGSVSAALHRGWIDVKTAVSSRDARAILEECERGEDYAKARYAQVLKDDDLDPELREVVARQYEGVLQNHARVKQLRDSLPR
jgi:uncharacterized protein (TIGR02284 family)